MNFCTSSASHSRFHILVFHNFPSEVDKSSLRRIFYSSSTRVTLMQMCSKTYVSPLKKPGRDSQHSFRIPPHSNMTGERSLPVFSLLREGFPAPQTLH